MQSLVDELDLKGAKRDVLRTYADAANNEGITYVGRAYLCWVTGLSAKHVKRIVAELKEDELLVQHGFAERGENGELKSHKTPGRGRFPLYKVQPEKGDKKLPYNEFKKIFYEEENSDGKGDIQGQRKGDIRAQERGTGVPQEPTEYDPLEEEPVEEESTNVSSSSGEAEDPPTPERPEEVKAIGQWAIERLYDKIADARKRGWDLEDPPEVGRIGARYKDLAARHADETLLWAFDYMVHKAAGLQSDTPKAWCGLDTALDRVKNGWRPRLYEVVDDDAPVPKAEKDYSWLTKQDEEPDEDPREKLRRWREEHGGAGEFDERDAG